MTKLKTQKPTSKPVENLPKSTDFLSSTRNRNWLYIIILAIAFVPTYQHIFDKKIAFLGDNANYYVFGKAIAAGEGYTNVHIIGQPPVNSYPPGYPAVIAVVSKVFGSDISTIKIANGFMFFGALVAMFFFFRAITLNEYLSFILVFVMMFNFYLLQYSTWMMSEIPFTLFTVLALLALSKIDLSKPFYKSPMFVLMLLSVFIAYNIRSQGIALVGAVMIFFLFSKKWLHAGSFTFLFGLMALPYYLRGKSLGASPYETALTLKDYYDPSKGNMENLGDWADRFVENFSRYVTNEIPSAIFGYEPDYEAGSWFYGLLILGIITFGIIKLKSFRYTLGSYILATFAILMIWPPVWTGVRFMLPIVPLLIFLFFYGISEILVLILAKAGLQNVRTKIGFAALFGIAFFIFFPKVEVLHQNAKKSYEPLYSAYFNLAKWTNKNVEPNSVILCRKPMLFHIYSEHYVDGIPKIENVDEAMKIMQERYTHIVFYGDGLCQRYFVPVYQKYPQNFELVQQMRNPDVYLFKIKK